MNTETFPDFVEAIRQGKAAKIIRSDSVSVETTRLEPAYRAHSWSIPSFEFGFLFDDRSLSFIGKQLCDDLWAVGSLLSHEGKLRMPFPECAFLFRYSRNAARPETVNLIHLFDSGDGLIEGNIYFQQDRTKPHNIWTRMPYQFVILPNSVVEINLDPDAALSRIVDEDYREDTRTKYTECIYAALLLSSGNDAVDLVEELTPRLKQVNRGRVETAKLDPLPATRLIVVDKQMLAREPTQAPGSGTPKRPHERRGFYRRLKDDRTVWVRETRVKGGSAEPPNYRVSKRDTDPL